MRLIHRRSSQTHPAFSQNPIHALDKRVVHHFLRLTSVDIGFQIRMLLAASTSATYQSLKWWKEALDIAIVKADMFVVTRGLFLDFYLSSLAHALMACKKLPLAAEIFRQVSETTTAFSDRTTYIGHQGNVLRLNGSFDEAEHCLFEIFRLGLTEYRGNLSHETVYETLVRNICTIYFQRTSADFILGEPWSLQSKVSYLLYAILEVAYLTKRIDKFVNPLAKKFRKAQAAKKGLFAAFQSAAAQETSQASTEAFRTGIYSLLHNGYRFEEIDFDTAIYLDFWDNAKTWKSDEQKAQIEQGEQAATIRCGNNECRCSSLQKPMERCAKCHDIHYCSRECQVAHWPDHKTRCKVVAKALKAGLK